MHRVSSRGVVTCLAVVLGSSLLLAQSGPRLQSALAKLPSGVTLHYVVQGPPEGESVVLLHGIGDSWHSFELVLPHLPATARVYAVTLRGHGLSDGPPSGYAVTDLAA